MSNSNSTYSNTQIPIKITTNLDEIITQLTNERPIGFTGPFLTAWGYSSRAGCNKANYVGNICNINAEPGTTSGFTYSINLEGVLMSSKLNLGFVMSYYNNGATYGAIEYNGTTYMDNINVTAGIHNIYNARLCPLLTNNMNANLTLYQTMTYSYLGCTFSNVQGNAGLSGLYPPTGLVGPLSNMTANPSSVPYDILLNFLQEKS